MQILQINASYKPAYIYGGPTMSVSKLCEELIKAGKEVEVLTTTANGATELNLKPGIKTIVDGVPVTYFKRITKDHSHFSPALLFYLWKILKKINLDSKAPFTHSHISTSAHLICHIHAWWNLVSIFSCIIAFLRSKPVLLSPRGTLSNYSFGNRKSLLKNIFHKTFGKTLLKRCHFHVTSEKEKQDIINIIHPKSITIIPNFVNLGPTPNCQLQTPNSKLQTPFRLLFLSRIEEKKGLDILLRALKLVQIPWHLTIAGTGLPDYISFLKSLITELHLSDRITWIGQQDNEQKFAELAGHDLMILPSHDESFANVVIESLSVGTPVLISSKVGLADYVLATNFGWVCSTDVEGLAVTIEKAFAEVNRRTEIRKNSPGQIRIDYDDKRLIDRYIQMYQEILTDGDAVTV